MFGLSAEQLIIILLIILIIFGGSQLPKLARNLGNSPKELRKGLDEGESDKPVAKKTTGKKTTPKKTS